MKNPVIVTLSLLHITMLRRGSQITVVNEFINCARSLIGQYMVRLGFGFSVRLSTVKGSQCNTLTRIAPQTCACVC